MRMVRWIGLAVLILFSGLSLGLSSVLLVRVDRLEADLATERKRLASVADMQQASAPLLLTRIQDLEDAVGAERRSRELTLRADRGTG